MVSNPFLKKKQKKKKNKERAIGSKSITYVGS